MALKEELSVKRRESGVSLKERRKVDGGWGSVAGFTWTSGSHGVSLNVIGDCLRGTEGLVGSVDGRDGTGTGRVAGGELLGDWVSHGGCVRTHCHTLMGKRRAACLGGLTLWTVSVTSLETRQFAHVTTC